MKKVLVLVGIVFMIILYPLMYSVSKETIEITVNDKERITTGDESKYLVYTEGETFENVDDLVRLKFSSSDLQGSLKKDSTYKVLVIGWRVPFLSKYRNILKVIK